MQKEVLNEFHSVKVNCKAGIKSSSGMSDFQARLPSLAVHGQQTNNYLTTRRRQSNVIMDYPLRKGGSQFWKKEKELCLKNKEYTQNEYYHKICPNIIFAQVPSCHPANLAKFMWRNGNLEGSWMTEHDYLKLVHLANGYRVKLQRQRSLGASRTRLEQSRTLLPPPETQQNNAESLEARRIPNNKDNIQQIIIIIIK